MNAATRHAGLKALRAGLDEAIAQTQGDAVDDFRREGTDRWRTPFGTVSIAMRQPQIRLDPAAFLAWVKRHRPTEVITTETVRTSYQDAVVKRLVIDGDDVIDPETGEVVEWASVQPGGHPYLSVRDANAAKAHAVQLVLGHLDELVATFAAPPEVIES